MRETDIAGAANVVFLRHYDIALFVYTPVYYVPPQPKRAR